jgi:hypothetical protein
VYGGIVLCIGGKKNGVAKGRFNRWADEEWRCGFA